MSQIPFQQKEEDGWAVRRIVTPRLLVRAFRPEDAEDLHEYLSSAETYRFEPGEPVDRREAQELAIEMSAAADLWAVELQTEHRAIGQIYFKQAGPPHLMTWELGYIIGPRYQRRGYASEAIPALLRNGFVAAGIHRVVAHCNPENTASWKLLEGIGFRREGLLKKQVFFHKDLDGDPLWTDTLVYAMLEEEFPQED